jgi:uncharacterized alkaline shock family protein YloU
VYALVGKSGSGKSFRARLVMDKYGVDLMVDDGLLIKDQKILAGKSAKREKAYLAAVKTALFHDRVHRRLVRVALENEQFKRILVLGTSDKMIDKICSALKLPAPTKRIHIEEIATAEEINTAMHYRNTQGKHVIPVPTIEVQRNYPRAMADSMKILLKRGFGIFKKHNVYEKSVVRPEFSTRGSVTISEAALSQMILHCVDEFAEGLEISKVSVKNDARGYHLHVFLVVPPNVQLSGMLHDLQQYMIESIERFTGIIIDELNITIDHIKQGPKLEEKGSRR